MTDRYIISFENAGCGHTLGNRDIWTAVTSEHHLNSTESCNAKWTSPEPTAVAATLFQPLGEISDLSSPHFPARSVSLTQRSSPCTSHLWAPKLSTFSQDNLEGPSDKLESVGTREYHGVICFKVSKAIVATRICFATGVRVEHATKVSRTPLLSV